jgi:asparagine synthase (glutamine-hydrolysing)
MVSGNQDSVIVFNGEIYNYLELRDDLESAGSHFRTKSDTEVLLEALRVWGPSKTLKRVIGMFAFGLWTESKRTLLLARDRVGKKPLYVAAKSGSIAFASEIKALKAIGYCRTINTAAVNHYLSFGCLLGQNTIYSEVGEVSPGEWIEIDSSLNVNRTQYWIPVASSDQGNNDGDAVERIESLLRSAITLRLRADVPVGIFLSGGIDSGLITAFAAESSGQPLRTFTICFNDGGFDERPLARLTAERFRTKHQEILLEPRIEETLLAVVDSYDEPFGDPSAVPTFAVAKEASKYVKVVLSGEGSDEIFCGYRRHVAARIFGRLRKGIEYLPRACLSSLQGIFRDERSGKTVYSWVRRFLEGVKKPLPEQYIAWGSDGFTQADKSLLLRSAPLESSEVLLLNQLNAYGPLDPLKSFMMLDFCLALADGLLVKLDIATMAHGLEARCPFLDHRLVELGMGLNSNTLIPGFRNKPLLRKLATRVLPQEVARAPKRGFEIPLASWLLGPLREFSRDACLRRNGLMESIFRRNQLEDFLSNGEVMNSGRWSKRMWILLMLALWDIRNSA